MEKYLHLLSRGDKIGLTLIRLSIAIVFMWIGLLKFVPYEADSITPFVANSPLMSFFYEHPEDYKQYLTHEGEYKPEARAWQSANNTYGFSNGLGVVEVIIALLVLAKEGANKRGNSSRLTQSFHFFMFEPIFSPVNALNQPI
ncbi:DUF417 family protein [Escherichia coli]|uniref:DUF417 family protein n=1 Tax=Escherichia coli TaxID=562 RepID=UPI0002841AF3|nr:DUF417 family protein [Escherichia coli]ASF05625.1 DUF417 domain-containing protein [Escherichia coli O104:H4]AFS58656.1 hypothetical protein O3M_19965 [Escherichia coli O104:H4 str. 2009EL-2050]AFS84835.1 hypothetical protein O3O_05315 [Escherichia coli O104:H4 str. 2009EL-2071]ATG07239.1 DUF417 domain-containing protein [Escherichia coli]EKZ35579.1 inner membrane protein ykgB [Escherichia coli O104:H4 str. Ec11-9450]